MLNCRHEIWLWIKCVINIWCDITCVVSCELYNNSSDVYLEKIVYTQSVKRKM